MGFPLELVERNSEIDTTVGAVCDRAQSLSFGKMRGHRPCLQKLWYQIHCYAPFPARRPLPDAGTGEPDSDRDGHARRNDRDGHDNTTSTPHYRPTRPPTQPDPVRIDDGGARREERSKPTTTNRPQPRTPTPGEGEQARPTPREGPPTYRHERPAPSEPTNNQPPPPRQEAPHYEPPRREPPRQESPRQETPRQEAPRQESPRKDPPASSSSSHH